MFKEKIKSIEKLILFVLLLPLQALWGQKQEISEQIEQFESWLKEVDLSYQDYLSRQDDAWRAYVANIEAKWNEFEESTKKKWIDYSDDINVKSRVEFEKGYAEIEAIQEADNPLAKQVAEEKMKTQLRKLLSPDNDAHTNVLENQIVYDEVKQKFVDKNNAQDYFRKKVKDQIQTLEQFTAKDSKKRIRYRVRIPFVKNHIVRRAQKYLPMVVKYTSQYNLEPRLVLAIIYVESAFNPLALSHRDAYGLMQLIPRHGAKEAYQFVYKKDQKVNPNFLYKPENNIQLGCAYLYLLLNSHWHVEPHELKKRDLSICSYNWGPHNVKQKIYDPYNGKDLSYQQLYFLLLRHTPDETSEYLEKVLKSQSYFDVFFENY